MRILYKSIAAAAICATTFFSSCLDKLNIEPIDPNQQVTIETREDYFAFLTKLYAGLSNTGQNGGDSDVGGGDAGATQYWRVLWNAQEFPTDEVVNTWNDEGAPQMNFMTWSANNPFVLGMYNRIYYQISMTNEFLRQSEALKLEDLPAWEEGSEYSDETLEQWVAEARFLRAFSYWHALDIFGNKVPFITEKDPIGSFMPMPAGTNERGAELFNFVKDELETLVAADSKLPAIKTAWLGRADKGAALMLLSKLYLNHEVYLDGEVAGYYETGRAHLKTLIDGGYSLYTETDADAKYSAYQSLFLSDNEKTAQEVIFMLMQDSRHMRHWGGTTYLIAAATGGGITGVGINSGWGGNRTTSDLILTLEKLGGDDRSYDDAANPALDLIAKEDEGQTRDMELASEFTQGYGIKKWKNLQQNGEKKNAEEGVFTDTNIPVFRLADAYLMLAEFDLRINGAATGESLDLVNQVLTRANAKEVTEITEDFLLDERARELYWEGHRRTDLIRFGKYTGGKNWVFKGGSASGIQEMPSHLELYPIPQNDLGANTNLSQNAGY